MRKHHYVKVHLDRRGAHATQEWFDRRRELFSDRTMVSLDRQLFQRFQLWFHCDPGMESLVQSWSAVAPPNAVFTFGPYGTRPTSIPNCDYVYVTRLDSDDMLSSDAMGLVDAVEPDVIGCTEASMFCRGHMLELETGRRGVYCNSSSPFHTVMFPRHVFCDDRLYMENFVGDHSMVGRKYRVHRLPDWKFTVLIHGSNFLSTFDYSHEDQGVVEREWSLDRWMAQPVVFDVDDLCDKWQDCIEDLDRLRYQYPKFRCTLFAIPAETSARLLTKASKREWLELATHGITHVPNLELQEVTPAQLTAYFRNVDWGYYSKGFRPPGWFITEEHCRALSDMGMYVALHQRDRKLAPACKAGVYWCDARLPSWHGHTHDVCGNWLKGNLEALLRAWPRDQEFSTVGEAVLCAS